MTRLANRLVRRGTNSVHRGASGITYRYFRFTPTAIRNSTVSAELQLAEFAVLSGTTRMTGMTITAVNNTVSTGEEPDKAGDDNLNTKWYDPDGIPVDLIYDFSSPVTATGYRWATADDAPDRDPVSWTVSGSNDNSNWTTLDTVTDFATPTARLTYLADFTFGGGGGGGGNTLPSAIAGLAGWWQADAITTPPADGGALASWNDSSTANRTFAQATTANQPTYRTSGAFLPNGKPVVEFTAASSKLMTLSSVTTNGDLTRFIVLRPKTIPASGSAVLMGGTSGSHEVEITPNGKVSTAISGVQWISLDAALGSPLTAGQWYIVTVMDTARDHYIHINGWFDARATSGHATPTATSMNLGGATTANYFDGYIAEAIDYNRLLGGVERAQVQSYLAAKYGITIKTNNFPIVDSPGRLKSFWLHLNSTATSDATIALEANRRKYIILNSGETDYIKKIKAANPNCMCLAYQDLSSTRTTESGTEADIPTGVSYVFANANRPDWFLLDSGGSRLMYQGYVGHAQMNVIASGYAEMWANNVAHKMAAQGFDGILADNMIFFADEYHPGVVSPSYSTDDATKAAYVQALAVIHPILTAAGVKIIGNQAQQRVDPGTWDMYDAKMDGGFDEGWLAFGPTSVLDDNPEGWSAVVAQIGTNESLGKFTLVQPDQSATAVAKIYYYTLASYFCGNGGRSAYAEGAGDSGYGAPPPYRAEYDWNLGTPTGAYFAVAGFTKVFRRNFSNGTVIANANLQNTGVKTITLGGTYINETGASVTSVGLNGCEGAVLRITP